MRIGAIAICLWCCGCGCYEDLTESAEVQKTGMMGQCFVSKKELLVVKNRWLKMTEIATAEEADYIGSIVGKLESGTRVRIVRVERHCDGGGGLFALVEERKMPIGLVENGQFTGQKLVTGKGGISVDGGTSDRLWARCAPDVVVPPK